jgi:hypothetical protein
VHHIHDMTPVHWGGVALAIPATVVVLKASWRSLTARPRRRLGN